MHLMLPCWLRVRARRFVSAAVRGADGEVPAAITAQLLHAYLPPVDVELRVQIGGAIEDNSDYRSISIQVTGRVTCPAALHGSACCRWCCADMLCVLRRRACCPRAVP